MYMPLNLNGYSYVLKCILRFFLLLSSVSVCNENGIKHVFLELTRFLSFSPLQRCMITVTNDNSAWRLADDIKNVRVNLSKQPECNTNGYSDFQI